MLDTVKINHVQHISFTQSRLTDAVSVILSELLSYEHPSNGGLVLVCLSKRKPLAQFFSEDRFQVDSGRFSPIWFQEAMCLNL